jgi:hypothetical protein
MTFVVIILVILLAWISIAALLRSPLALILVLAFLWYVEHGSAPPSSLADSSRSCACSQIEDCRP